MSGAPQERGEPAPLPRGGPGRPVFLERATYRRRRLIDAIRLIPVLGGLLWAVPVLWGLGETPSSVALLYIFGVWLGLVIGAALLSRALVRAGEGSAAVGEAPTVADEVL